MGLNQNTVNWPILWFVLVYLMILACIGLFLKKRIKSGNDYWLGGRKNGPITTAISFNASYVSTVVVIGSPAYYFMYGMEFQVVEVLTSTLFLGIVLFAAMALKLRAVSERSGAVSLPGFLAVRYESETAQVISGILIAILMIPYGVAVLKAIGDALHIVAGIPYMVGVLIAAVTAVIYLSASGYLCMSRTDLIQGFTILTGVIVLSVMVGGATVTLACYAFPIKDMMHPFVPGILASALLLVVISLCTRAPGQDVIDLFFEKNYRKAESN